MLSLFITIIRVDIDEALGLQHETMFRLPLTSDGILTLSGKAIVAKYFLQILQVGKRLDSQEVISSSIFS